MRVSTIVALTMPMFLAVGCGGSSSKDGATGGAPGSGGAHASGGTVGSGGTGGSGGSQGATGGGSGHGSGGTPGSGGAHASGGTPGSGGAHASGGAPGTGGTSIGTDAGATSTDGGTIGSAGNPNGSCSAGLPTRGQPADVSSPTSVIGTGTAASCTFGQLQTAVAKGGVITFDCGSGAVAITVTATLNLPITTNTVIDGGNKITLDGGKAVRILSFNSNNYQTNTNTLTLQHIALVNGKTTPTELIPTAPAPCSQGYDDGQGGAILINDGNLNVVDCIFTGNEAAQLGPDTGGGAIYIEGSKNGAVIAGSTFSDNSGSNAGAVGALQSGIAIYNSLFTNNTATGNGANSNDATMCSVIHAKQNQVGSGGNGGAIAADGNSFNVTLCGDAILNNAAGANAFGGGLIFTSDDMMGVLSIADTTMTGNTGKYWTLVSTGSVTDVGTAVGVSAKSITLANSTLQGVQ
jgi:hypothetical protein